MTPSRSPWLLLLAILAVTACAPLQVEYLKPSAPGAEYARSACGGASGPRDRAVLAGPDGYTIRVDAHSLRELGLIRRSYVQVARKQGRDPGPLSRDYQSGVGITVILQAPANRPVPAQFRSGSFVVVEDAGQVHEYRPGHALEFADVHVQLDGIVAALKSMEPVDGDARVNRPGILEVLPAIPPGKKWRGTMSRPYYVVLFFEDVRSGNFRFRVPELVIGDKIHEFPEIEFRLVEEWIVAPLNC